MGMRMLSADCTFERGKKEKAANRPPFSPDGSYVLLDRELLRGGRRLLGQR
jgi:hypothetical protein